MDPLGVLPGVLTGDTVTLSGIEVRYREVPAIQVSPITKEPNVSFLPLALRPLQQRVQVVHWPVPRACAVCPSGFNVQKHCRVQEGHEAILSLLCNSHRKWRPLGMMVRLEFVPDVRPARASDLPDILEILNHEIANGYAHFGTEAVSLSEL